MKLRQFWKVMMWWSKEVRHHPLYKKIRLDDISKVEYMQHQKHERNERTRTRPVGEGLPTKRD